MSYNGLVTREDGRTLFHTTTGGSGNVEVNHPCQPRDSWQGEWDPARHAPEFGDIRVRYGYRSMSATEVQDLAAAMQAAARFLDSLHDEHAETLAYQMAAVREREAAEALKVQEEEDRRKGIQENVQWLIGQKFRLRRRGYRATVFGTIQRVDARYIHTISEKGKRMEIAIDTLEHLEVKYEGERAYTVVHTEGGQLVR